MKYTTESPEFLLAYPTLNDNLNTTPKTCDVFNEFEETCKGCEFHSTWRCDPFADLRETFNKEEFEAAHPELLL